MLTVLTLKTCPHMGTKGLGADFRLEGWRNREVGDPLTTMDTPCFSVNTVNTTGKPTLSR